MSEFDLLSVAADRMAVQRTMLDVAARNVAAAQASTPEHPYPRLVARFASGLPGGGVVVSPSGGDRATAFAGEDDGFDPVPEPGDEQGGDAPLSRYLGTARAGESADALTEMISVLDAQRAYEANASVFDVGKKLAERTLDVGRG